MHVFPTKPSNEIVLLSKHIVCYCERVMGPVEPVHYDHFFVWLRLCQNYIIIM